MFFGGHLAFDGAAASQPPARPIVPTMVRATAARARTTSERDGRAFVRRGRIRIWNPSSGGRIGPLIGGQPASGPDPTAQPEALVEVRRFVTRSDGVAGSAWSSACPKLKP